MWHTPSPARHVPQADPQLERIMQPLAPMYPLPPKNGDRHEISQENQRLRLVINQIPYATTYNTDAHDGHTSYPATTSVMIRATIISR